MIELTDTISVRYEREHGVHTYETVDGMPITAVSAPTWEEYVGELEQLPQTSGYVVSPELMTSPHPLEQIPALRPAIQARIQQVRRISEKHPYAYVLLGTPTFNGAQKPHNSVVAFQSGSKTGQQHKASAPFHEAEENTFEFDNIVSRAALDIAAHGLVICSEIMMAATLRRSDYITPQTRSLLMVSCWGVPLPHHERYPMEPETRYRKALEDTVKHLMKTSTQVEEVIIVDRAIVGHGVEPFNAHFKRH